MAERISSGYFNSFLSHFVETYKNGVLAIYSGTQPPSADDAETGNLLCLITKDGGAFTPGEATNGLNFGAATGNTANKADAETWSGTVLMDGIAGWFRFYDNNYVTGASSTAARFDGAITNTDTEEIHMMDNTNLITGSTVTVDNFQLVIPVE